MVMYKLFAATGELFPLQERLWFWCNMQKMLSYWVHVFQKVLQAKFWESSAGNNKNQVHW